MQQEKIKTEERDGRGHDGDGDGDIQGFDDEWLFHGRNTPFFDSIPAFSPVFARLSKLT